MQLKVAIGKLVHRRLHPREHAFVYGLYDVLLPVHDWHVTRQGLFGIDQFNLMSVYSKDYGPRDGTALLPWINNLLKKEAITGVTTIWLMTMPRIFGFAFNPVSFWFCVNDQKEIIAVLCEVNNTFGEHHNYLAAHDDSRPIEPHEIIKAKKVFHVSPFLEVTGYYQFRFEFTAQKINVHIDYFTEHGLTLVAHQSATIKPLSNRAQLHVFLGYPLVTFKVVVSILWNALRLLLKKMPVFTKPIPPQEETTR